MRCLLTDVHDLLFCGAGVRCPSLRRVAGGHPHFCANNGVIGCLYGFTTSSLVATRLPQELQQSLLQSKARLRCCHLSLTVLPSWKRILSSSKAPREVLGLLLAISNCQKLRLVVKSTRTHSQTLCHPRALSTPVLEPKWMARMSIDCHYGF